MTTFRKILGCSRHASLFFALCALGSVAGCSPADDDESSDRDPAPPDEAPIEGQRDLSAASSSGGVIDKAIEQHFCCVAKKGNRVKSCRNTYIGRVNAALECNAVLTDNVIRDGMCSGYASCTGKTTNPDFPHMPPPGFGNSFPSDSTGF